MSQSLRRRGFRGTVPALMLLAFCPWADAAGPLVRTGIPADAVRPDEPRPAAIRAAAPESSGYNAIDPNRRPILPPSDMATGSPTPALPPTFRETRQGYLSNQMDSLFRSTPNPPITGTATSLSSGNRVQLNPQPGMPLPPTGTLPPTGAMPQTVSNNVSGGPAWKWYGYGSTTPGQNPFAPTGSYAAVPASWVTQSGATPGAFPNPVMNPYRVSQANEPASYIANMPPLPIPMPAPRPEPEAIAAPKASDPLPTRTIPGLPASRSREEEAPAGVIRLPGIDAVVPNEAVVPKSLQPLIQAEKIPFPQPSDVRWQPSAKPTTPSPMLPLDERPQAEAEGQRETRAPATPLPTLPPTGTNPAKVPPTGDVPTATPGDDVLSRMYPGYGRPTSSSRWVSPNELTARGMAPPSRTTAAPVPATLPKAADAPTLRDAIARQQGGSPMPLQPAPLPKPTVVASLPSRPVARGASAPAPTPATAPARTVTPVKVEAGSGESRPDYLPRLIHERIRAAAGDGAGNLAIEATGLWKLRIGFRAASANEARAAVQRVSSLLELTRYEIDFAVSVGK